MRARFSKFLPYLALICAVLIFLILTVQNLDYPVWFDEGYTAYLIKGNFSEIWSLTAADVHPPFYYFLLKIWSCIFGSSLISLRAMSVCFGAASLVLLFFLIKRWFNSKTAAGATILTAFSPFLIRYGMEMRMYMLILFIVVGATYLLTLAVEKNRKIYWALYALLVALGMYTHYFTALVWLAHLCYLKFVLGRPIFKSPILLAYLGAVLLYLPWLPALFSQIKSISNGFWIPEVSAVTPLNFFTNIFAFKNASDLTSWGALLVLCFIAVYYIIVRKAYLLSQKTAKSKLLFLLIFMLLPPTALFLISLIYKPMFVDRYLVPSGVIAWTLLGCAFAAKTSCKILPSFLSGTVIILTIVFGSVNVLNRAPDSYASEIITEISQTSENEPILAGDIWAFFGTAIYTTDSTPIYGTLETTFTNGWGSEEPMKYYTQNLPHTDSQVYETLNDFLADHPRFWYITEDEATLPTGDFKILDELKTDHYFAFELES